MEKNMKVLVTGVDGYIGSVLAPLLIQEGHTVLGVDARYYRDGWLYSDQTLLGQTPATNSKDIRHISHQDLEGVDAIVHLAELSNDPLGENSPEVTYAINHRGSVRLADLAKEMGITRFVYTSSCSVYGVSDADFVDESSAVDPQTAYAKCKVLVENDVGKLANDNFSPTFLRNATAFGASPRMRFDIVLNNLAGLAWTTQNIAMTSDGTPWRPLVHVLDICGAISSTLCAPREAIHNQIFNVGSSRANYTVRQIAEIVASHFPGCKTTFGPAGGDNRSYRVNFDKIENTLESYKAKWDADAGAAQFYELFKRIDMTRDVFEFRAFTRLKQLEYLLRTSQLDDDFFWREAPATAAK
jgi:nucleoside-diphosphate-sugar epimerase